MQLLRASAVVFALLRGAWAKDADGCTTIAVSKDAMEDGSALVGHANDCQDCDFRVAYVPAQDHPEGSMRTVYTALWAQYPRLVDPSRSRQYIADLGINSTQVLGYIPQVPHTFALWESSYSIINEKGLGMGESTCSAFLVGNATTGPGKPGALFSIGNLMQVALERCETSRCAVQLMGDLATKYGFYGEDPGMPGAGETVTVVDKSGDLWVFHISGGLPELGPGAPWAGQRGALWAAQRVPEGHLAVVANNFIIRAVDPKDTENFMLHPGLFDLAQEAGLWDGKGVFDFLLIMTPDIKTFSYNPALPPIPYYTTMRLWSVMRKAAPSANIPISDSASDYPFSVKVEKKLTLHEVMDMYRSHYEGTEFDMRLGVMAGPWQSPNRVEGGFGQVIVPGVFARAFSIPRTAYTQVVQSGNAQPVLWFAPDASASSVYVPFFASVLAHGDGKFDEKTFGQGSAKTFSFTDGEMPNAWWAFDFVANWMDLCYHNMSETYVYPKMRQLQKEMTDKVSAAVAAVKDKSDRHMGATLADLQTQLQRYVVEEWWAMAGKLVVRYNDHFFNYPEWAPTKQSGIGYPAFWLEMIGYDSEFYRPRWIQKSQMVPTLLPAEEMALLPQAKALELTSDSRDEAKLTPGFSSSGVLLSADTVALMLCACTLMASHLALFKLGQRRGQHEAAEAANPPGSEYVRFA